MNAYWEIVRSTAEQPWHARLFTNGRISVRTENYTRMVGAERAILSTARAHGIDASELRWNVEGVEKLMFNTAGRLLGSQPLVKYTDERAV